MTFGLGAAIWFGLLLVAAAFKPICDNPFTVIVGLAVLALPFLIVVKIIAGAFGVHLTL